MLLIGLAIRLLVCVLCLCLCLCSLAISWKLKWAALEVEPQGK